MIQTQHKRLFWLVIAALSLLLTLWMFWKSHVLGYTEGGAPYLVGGLVMIWIGAFALKFRKDAK